MKVGLLLCFNCYLTCSRGEKGMLEDYYATLQLLATGLRIRLVPGFSITSASGIVSLSGWPSDILLNIAVPAEVFEKLPEELKQGQTLKVVPILFNVGINEQAYFASYRETKLQSDINMESVATLKSYAELACEEMCHGGSMGDRNRRLVTQLLADLQKECVSAEKMYKNVDILHHVTRICRLVRGTSFITCKSGKDRTSMAVTLEEVFLLQQLGLPEVELQPTLDKLRRDGVRRENLVKNANVTDYAFNGLQVRFLPELYKPPENCYASGQT